MSGPADDIREYWIDESRWDPSVQYADLNVAGWAVTADGLTYMMLHFGPEALSPLGDRDGRYRNLISMSASRSPRGFMAFLINTRRLGFAPPGMARHEISEERHGKERALELRSRCGNGLDLLKEDGFRAVYRRIREASKTVQRLAREDLVRAKEEMVRGLVRDAVIKSVSGAPSVPRRRVLEICEEEIELFKVRDVMES